MRSRVISSRKVKPRGREAVESSEARPGAVRKPRVTLTTIVRSLCLRNIDVTAIPPTKSTPRPRGRGVGVCTAEREAKGVKIKPGM